MKKFLISEHAKGYFKVDEMNNYSFTSEINDAHKFNTYGEAESIVMQLVSEIPNSILKINLFYTNE